MTVGEALVVAKSSTLWQSRLADTRGCSVEALQQEALVVLAHEVRRQADEARSGAALARARRGGEQDSAPSADRRSNELPDVSSDGFDRPRLEAELLALRVRLMTAEADLASALLSLDGIKL